MKKVSNLTAKRYYAFYSVFFWVIALLIFGVVMYYGKTIIDNHDALNQYYAAFQYFSDYLQNVVRSLIFEGQLELPLWDFHIGMGSDVLTSLNYYVIGDPLNLISVIVPNAWMEVVFQLLIVLRMYLAGIAFSMFARKIGCRKWHTALGAYIYVFSMFALYSATMYAAFPNVLIYLPLLLLGIEKVFRKEKSYVLLFTITLCLVSNFYFSYMLAILAVIYCLIRYFSINAFVLKNQGVKIGGIVKDLFSNVFRMLVPIVVGALLSCAVLLPVLYAFLHQGRGAGQVVDNLFVFSGNMYAEIIGSAFSPKIAADYNLMGYCPIVFLCILLLFRRSRGFLQKKKMLRVSFIVCAVLLFVPLFGYAMNGFAYVNARWIFALSFVCGMVVVMYFEKLLTLSKKSKALLTVGTLCYMLVYFVWDDLHTETIAVSVVVMLAFLALVLGFENMKFSYGKKYAALFVVVLACIAYYGGFFFSPKRTTTLDSKLDKGAVYTLEDDRASGAATKIKDNSFYRVDVMEDNTLNDGLLLDYNPVAFYYSLFDKGISEWNKELLNNQMTVPNLSHGHNARTYLNLLSGVKYVVSDTKGYIPYGYEKKKTHVLSNATERTLSKNTLQLPFGYTQDKCFDKETYQTLTPLQKEQVMLQSAVVEQTPEQMEKLTPVFTEKELSYTVEKLNGVKMSDDMFTIVKPDATITLNVNIPKDSEVFVYGAGISFTPYSPVEDPAYYLRELNSEMEEKMWQWKYRNLKAPDSVVVSAEMKKRTDSVTLQQESNKYYWGKDSFLLSLGTRLEGSQKIVLTFSNIGEYKFSDFKIMAEDLSVLPAQVAKLKTENLKNVRFASNWIEGNITTTGKKMLMLSVPYSEGWSVWINGKETKLERVNTMWSAVYLDKPGDYKVTMQYRTPWLIPGILVSIVTLIGFIGFVLIKRIIMRRRG